MTNEQLTLARQFCEAVGWNNTFRSSNTVAVERPPEVLIPSYGFRQYSWLFTGDGMLAVKAEMAKRGVYIASCPNEGISVYAAWIADGDEFLSTTEPHAVLLAAVAAMKGDH